MKSIPNEQNKMILSIESCIKNSNLLKNNNITEREMKVVF